MKRQQSPKHRKWIATLPCVVCGNPIATEAAHVRASSAAAGKVNPGIGRRPDDRHVVPLCHGHHAEQHRGNEIEFWEEHGLSIEDVIQIAEALHAKTGDAEAAQRIIATRGTI